MCLGQTTPRARGLSGAYDLVCSLRLQKRYTILRQFSYSMVSQTAHHRDYSTERGRVRVE